jgi:hypothetical protein
VARISQAARFWAALIVIPTQSVWAFSVKCSPALATKVVATETLASVALSLVAILVGVRSGTCFVNACFSDHQCQAFVLGKEHSREYIPKTSLSIKCILYRTLTHLSSSSPYIYSPLWIPRQHKEIFTVQILYFLLPFFMTW